jgi:branched-chain amino acid transport system permease protein
MTEFLNILFGGLLIGGIYSLISMGMSLQYGTAKVMNIAHGEFLIFGAFITLILQQQGVNPLLCLLIVTPLFFIVGFVLYRTIFTTIRVRSANPGVFEGNGLLAAFGLYFIFQSAATLIWGSSMKGYSYLTTSWSVGGADIFADRLLAAVFAIALGILFYWYLNVTRSGKAIRAAAQDTATAGLMGVNINFVLALCFGFGAAMAGAAGTLFSVFSKFNTTMGLQQTLLAIVVVTLGGLGSIPGAFIGGFILGLISTAVSYWQPSLTIASYYVIFIILLLVRPKGIMGK